MDPTIRDMLAGINSLDRSRLNARVERRFLDAIERPLAELLGLPLPVNRQRETEAIYVTYIGASNNIDNRLWQAQNKMLIGLQPRLAVALCPESIVNDHMFEFTSERLTRLARREGLPEFQGVLIVAKDCDDPVADDGVFSIARLVVLDGAPFGEVLSEAIPGIPVTTYEVDTPSFRRSLDGNPVDDSIQTVMQLLSGYRNLILEGVAGTGKSFLIDALADHFAPNGTEVAVFHAQTSYEDFVEGLRPTSTGDFAVRDGRFLAFCRRAANDPENQYLFVIDEINRAAPAKVLGDLLYAIEPSKRVDARSAAVILADRSTPSATAWAEAGIPVVHLQLEREGPHGPYAQMFCVPDNVYILGTMNTSDHSIGVFDLALRRRFVFHRVEPLEAADLLAVLDGAGVRGELEVEVAAWSRVNEILGEISQDAKLGHSYFFEAIQAAERLNLDDVAQLPILLWRDLLLPQIAAVLVAYGAVHLLPELESAILLSGSSSGGYWISDGGRGVDAYPFVVRRAESIPIVAEAGGDLSTKDSDMNEAD